MSQATFTREQLTAGLCLRANLPDIEKAFTAETLDRGGHGGKLSLFELCREACRLDNIRIDCLTDREECIRAGFSTGSLPYILGNAATKFLQQGFGDASKGWRRIARPVTVPDFKAADIVRLQDTGDLEEVTGEGEVPYAARSEDRESLQARTYARNWGVSRQDVYNDDLGVLTRIPEMHGRRAATSLAKLIWKHVMSNPTMNDSVAFFHATHKNLNTSHALAPDTLATAVRGFRNQTDTNGDPVDVSPAVLAVPPTLEELARQLCVSPIILPYGGTSGTTRGPTANVWAGSLAPLVEPRLENANYTGYATDAWYLFADPAELAALVVGFLNDRQEPTLEAFNAGPGRMGITMRVSLDAGVRVAEYRAASKQTA